MPVVRKIMNAFNLEIAVNMTITVIEIIVVEDVMTMTSSMMSIAMKTTAATCAMMTTSSMMSIAIKTMMDTIAMMMTSSMMSIAMKTMMASIAMTIIIPRIQAMIQVMKTK
jgi:hypothetical protein